MTTKQERYIQFIFDDIKSNVKFCPYTQLITFYDYVLSTSSWEMIKRYLMKIDKIYHINTEKRWSSIAKTLFNRYGVTTIEATNIFINIDYREHSIYDKEREIYYLCN